MFVISTCLDTNYTHKAAPSAASRMAQCTAELSAFRSVHFQVSQACIITAVTASFWCASPRRMPPFSFSYFAPSFFDLIFATKHNVSPRQSEHDFHPVVSSGKACHPLFHIPFFFFPFLNKLSIIKTTSFTKYHLSSMPQPSFHRAMPAATNRIKASN